MRGSPHPSGADARTTPPRARPLVLAGLAAMAMYLLLCFRVALGGYEGFDTPPLLATLEPALWAGRWRMFTDLRTTHTDLDVEIRVSGEWQPLNLATLYPLRWDEGPGYTREAFLVHEPRVRALALDLCERTHAEAVKLSRVIFDKTPGSAIQPRVNPQTTLLLERRCGS